MRGGATHDAIIADDRKVRDAEELWGLVMGVAGGGFLARFHSELGLTEMVAANGVGLPLEQVPDNRVLPEENGAVELADQQPATIGARRIPAPAKIHRQHDP